MRKILMGSAVALFAATAAWADDTAAPAAPPATTATPAAPATTMSAPPASTTPSTTAPASCADPMAVLYGNSIIVKGSGPETHTRYSADHTFEGIAPEYNYPYKGTWLITPDGKLCRTFDPAVPTVSNPDCDAPISGHAVGDTWTDAKGNTISIVAGVQ